MNARFLGRAADAKSLVALLAVMSIPLTAHAEDEQNTMAVWKQQRIDFYYRSSTAIYACSALKKRIESILYSVGARDDLKVDTSGCDPMLSPPAQTMPAIPDRQTRTDSMFRTKPSRGEQYAHVRIFVSSPVEATPEVMAALKKDKPRRELLGKVTGKPEAAIEAETQFQAQRERVTLSRETVGLEAAECELLDQLVNTVFVDLDVRVVSRDYSCSPGHNSRIPPKMAVDALMPVIRVREPQIHPGEGSTEGPSDGKPEVEGEPQTGKDGSPPASPSSDK